MIDVVPSHIDDGALIRLLDGEGEPDALGLQQHLATCLPCQERLSELGKLGGRLDVLMRGAIPASSPVFDPAFLAAMDRVNPVRSRRRVPAFGLAAAAVLAALILVASPVGAWIAERIGRALTSADEPAAVETLPAPAPLAASAPVGAKVAASVAGTHLILRLDDAELPARVIVSRGEGSMATALVTGAMVPAEMLVRPDGFEVASSGGSLEVEIPAEITTLEVWIGSRVAARWPLAGVTTLPWEFVTADR